MQSENDVVTKFTMSLSLTFEIVKFSCNVSLDFLHKIHSRMKFNLQQIIAQQIQLVTFYDEIKTFVLNVSLQKISIEASINDEKIVMQF
jgi:hypothetical protein